MCPWRLARRAISRAISHATISRAISRATISHATISHAISHATISRARCTEHELLDTGTEGFLAAAASSQPQEGGVGDGAPVYVYMHCVHVCMHPPSCKRAGSEMAHLCMCTCIVCMYVCTHRLSHGWRPQRTPGVL